MEFLLTCFLPIALMFKVSKWIREAEKRALLVTTFRSIMDTHREKSCSNGIMPEFCDLASKENLSPGDLTQLQEWLQEISNMKGPTYLPMRWFLGRHRPIIGGTRGNYWNRAKMEKFLLHVNGWNGLQNSARAFRNTQIHDFTSNIIRQDRNGGKISEVEIYQISANGGKLPTSQEISESANIIALNTPRGQLREVAERSVISTHRSALGSSSSSVAVTPRRPPAYSCSSVGTTPLNSPRGHLCAAPPSRKSLVLEWFMARKGPSFNDAMKEACKNLTYSIQSLVQLYDVVKIHQRDFPEETCTNPITQHFFFKKLSNCALIQRTLQASRLFSSIEHVAFADEQIQIMFIEGLIFSFFQACRKPFFTLGISNIVPKQDGNGFSIELFPDYMINEYLNQFHPYIIGEHAPMA